jgi:protein TonB
MASSSVTGIHLEGAVPPGVRAGADPAPLDPPLRFATLAPSSTGVPLARGPVGTVVSVLAHAALVTLAVVVPLLMDVPPPDAEGAGVRAFFATPLELAPPPPPPPPPAAAKPVPRTQTPPSTRADAFVAPVVTPQTLPRSGLDLGVQGGVAGGVEGGVPGGVVGGVVGGLPDAPPPPLAPIRVGGGIKEPTKVRDVPPEYPPAAAQAGIEGVVVLECQISPQGRVTDVKVLRGAPLLDAAAVEAARQWVYTPTLMSGVPVPVIMTVTIRFDLHRR